MCEAQPSTFNRLWKFPKHTYPCSMTGKKRALCPALHWKLESGSVIFLHCHQKGPYYRDRVLIRTFLAFWVPIGSLFIFQGPYFQCFGFIHAKNVNSVCLHVYSSELTSVCLHVYRSELTWFVCDNFLHCYYTNMLWSDASQVILLANFVFFLCVKFHKSLFWVPILAAGGPYWVPISQKVGSLFQSLGVPISLCDSENAKKVPIWTQSL